MAKIKNKLIKCFDSFKLNTKTIFRFAWNDLKKRYSGSLGGIIWAYVQPLVSLLVFWFVFQVGFRNPPVDDWPFIVWLVPSFIAWNFVNDSISQATNVLYEYNFLVKKVKFNITILPIVKIVVAFIVHLFFIGFCYFLYLIYGIEFNVMWLQIFYYSFALIVLLIGVSWIVSSISVFWKDVSQIVNIILQIGFWLVPVFWALDVNNPMNPTVLFILKLNPFFYIIQGYRDCFIGNVPFWNYDMLTTYFWIATTLILIFGYFIFKKLSPHYPDLL